MISALQVGFKPCSFSFVPNDVFQIDTLDKRIHLKAINITVLPYEDNKTFKIERIRRLKLKFIDSNDEQIQFNNQNLVDYIKANLTDVTVPIQVEGLVTSDIEDVLLIEHKVIDVSINEIIGNIPNLLLHLPLNENLLDTSTNNYHATPNNTYEFLDNGIVLNNTNNYLKLNHDFSLTNLTFSCKVKFSDASKGNFIVDSTQYYAVTNWGSDFSALARSQNGGYTFRKYNGSNYGSITFSETLENNKWYHFAVIREENNNKIYIDGLEINPTSESYSDTPLAPLNLSSLLIGAETGQYTETENIFKNVRIYSRTLTQNEIQTLSNE